jgi:nitrate/nitrite transporter NarK
MLADRFGRRRMCLVYSVVHVATAFAAAFANRFESHLFRFYAKGFFKKN